MGRYATGIITDHNKSSLITKNDTLIRAMPNYIDKVQFNSV